MGRVAPTPLTVSKIGDNPLACYSLLLASYSLLGSRLYAPLATTRCFASRLATLLASKLYTPLPTTLVGASRTEYNIYTYPPPGASLLRWRQVRWGRGRRRQRQTRQEGNLLSERACLRPTRRRTVGSLIYGEHPGAVQQLLRRRPYLLAGDRLRG